VPEAWRRYGVIDAGIMAQGRQLVARMPRGYDGPSGEAGSEAWGAGDVGQERSNGRARIVIASPLEAEHVARIAGAHPDRTEVIHRPDLLPPTRYRGDHGGSPGWTRTPAQQAEWLALLAGAEIIWDFPFKTQDNLMAVTPRLRWVQTTSAGVGQLVKRLGLEGSDLIVTTASGVHAQPLAEFVFGVLLGHVKRFDRLREDQRAHRWERFSGGELAGQVMAIVGPGRIGREVARIARAFRMTVWAMGRDNTPDRAAALGVDRLFARDELRAMLAGADCVVLCAPHTAETENLIGRDELLAMQPGAVLVNIARGAMIDEDALVEVLRSGHLGLAALDVFRTEPLPPESPLWELPNVLINPHSASTADSENGKLTDRFIENLGHYLAGEIDAMQPRLDTTRLY
jgi:phosphoglycerate dehydrogenase-like enzyme